MNGTDKLIAEQVKTLPPDLVKAIDSVPWKALVQEIGRTNTLDAEQIVSLEQETMLIIYGFENPSDYASNIVKEVGVSEDIAYTVAESVANKIFEPILKKSEGTNNPPAGLPMVEKGEVAHTVPHVEPATNPSTTLGASQPKVSVPDYRYPGGQDPYREPKA